MAGTDVFFSFSHCLGCAIFEIIKYALLWPLSPLITCDPRTRVRCRNNSGHYMQCLQWATSSLFAPTVAKVPRTHYVALSHTVASQYADQGNVQHGSEFTLKFKLVYKVCDYVTWDKADHYYARLKQCNMAHSASPVTSSHVNYCCVLSVPVLIMLIIPPIVYVLWVAWKQQRHYRRTVPYLQRGLLKDFWRTSYTLDNSEQALYAWLSVS